MQGSAPSPKARVAATEADEEETVDSAEKDDEEEVEDVAANQEAGDQETEECAAEVTDAEKEEEVVEVDKEDGFQEGVPVWVRVGTVQHHATIASPRRAGDEMVLVQWSTEQSTNSVCVSQLSLMPETVRTRRQTVRYVPPSPSLK